MIFPWNKGNDELFLLQELKKHNAKDVVRVCDPTYKTDKLKQEGINVLVRNQTKWRQVTPVTCS